MRRLSIQYELTSWMGYQTRKDSTNHNVWLRVYKSRLSMQDKLTSRQYRSHCVGEMNNKGVG